MIKSFRHKGLDELFHKGKTKLINKSFYKKLRFQLNFLDSLDPGQVDKIMQAPWIPHRLCGKNSKGQDIEGHFSFKVTGNWRMVFKYDDLNGDVVLVDFIDYH